MRELLSHLNALGAKMNLTFSSWEFLKDALIGLDIANRKLLIVKEKQPGKHEEIVVSLDELESCSLKKVYGSIRPGDLKKRRLDQLLEKISLLFKFGGDKEPLEIYFFDNSEDEAGKRSELNKKARNWGRTLSEMLKYKKEAA